jgi:tRNA pseudouridine55 synthase
MDPQEGERQLNSQYFTEGAVLLVDKPQGWTSFDVVNKIRGKIRNSFQLKNIKVGHAGTLDPMATGLLIVCTGKETKRIVEYQDRPKEYTGTITFGATTPSHDAESEIDASFPFEHITPALLEQIRSRFLGEIEQVPPMFSAIKVDGQPLYKMARKGQSIKVEARKVQIYALEFTRIELPEVDFRVECSKGTYIRSLAYDLGKALKSGAYLSALRRTKIGEFGVEDAKGVMEWIDWMSQQVKD